MSVKKICDGYTNDARQTPHVEGLKEAVYGVTFSETGVFSQGNNFDYCRDCFVAILHYWETGGFSSGSEVTITRDINA